MKTRAACLLVRNQPVYRRDAFAAGLAAVGLSVSGKPSVKISQDDVLVIWNRYGINHHIARRYEDAGAAVFVTVNGYVNFKGARKSFALALNHHNGAGSWPRDGESRIHMLDIEIRPWLCDGIDADVLLLPQRGVGPPGIAMPKSWVMEVQKRIAGLGGRRRTVRIRPHPGTQREALPLASDIGSGVVCVTWASGAAIKALAYGAPVVHEFPKWVAAAGGSFGIGTLNNPHLGDRSVAMEAVARAQWTVDEVASGVPFARLLDLHAKRMER